MTQPAAALAGSVFHLRIVTIGGQPALAVARSRGIELIDARDGTVRRVLTDDLAATALAVLDDSAADGDMLLVGGGDGTVYTYDPGTGSLLSTQALGGGMVRDLAVFGEAGNRTVAAALENGVCLWSPDTGEIVRLEAPTGLESSRVFKVCAYSAAGRHLVTAGYTDGHLATWDTASLAYVQHGHEGAIWSITAVPDAAEPVVVTGGADRRARVWSPSDGGQLVPRQVFAADGTVRAVGHVGDLDVPVIVTGSAAGTVGLWRLDGPTERPESEISRHAAEVWAVACALTADGVVVASGDMAGEIQIKWLSAALLSEQSVEAIFETDVSMWAVTHGDTADGTYLACAGVDQIVHVIDPTGRRSPRSLIGHTSTIRSLAAGGGPASPHLISAGADHRVLDWDPSDGQLRRELPMGHVGEVWALAVFESMGALYLVSGGADGSLRLLALDGPEATFDARVVATDCGEITAVMVLPDVDGGTVVVGSGKGLRAFSLRDGATVPLALVAISAAIAVREGDRWLVIAAQDDGVVKLIDPVAGATVSWFAVSFGAGQVRALAALRVGGTTFVLGGCDDGRVLSWSLDGALVSNPVRGGSDAVRAMDVAELPAVGGGSRQALVSAGHDGVLRVWPVSVHTPLHHTEAAVDPVRTASFLMQDQPATRDGLSRSVLVETLYDALTSPRTEPPVVVGIHAPWGQGKSSVLHQLRHRIDPWTQPGEGTALASGEREASHRLVVTSARPADGWRRNRRGTVRVRLTRAWAWRQIRRAGDSTTPLDYEMRPVRADGHSAITVWFNPWMYERTDQLWAGLTREILTAVTNRLSPPERERLWFDLNLRRTEPNALRKRILASYLPRTLWGMLGAGLLLFSVTVAVVAMGTAAVNNPTTIALIGPSVLVALTILATVARLTSGSFQQVHTWLTSDELTGAPDAWRGGDAPLSSTERGYLYLLQHDVGEVLRLATRSGPLYIFVDDMDRCGPAVVADTIEAINLFLNKTFDPCMFVVALDPTTVAAHLETAFQDINERIAQDSASFGHLSHTGWRFMEKIIDLPVRLPRISDTALSQYFTDLLATATAPAPGEPLATTRRRPTHTAAPSPAIPAPAGDGRGPAPTAVKLAIVDPITTESRLTVVNEFENLPPVREALQAAVLGLPGRNPRQAKAFINLWRFYMILDHRSGMFSPSLQALERHSIELARVIELMLRWPFLLDMLGSPAIDAPHSSNIDLLLDSCDDDEVWSAVTGRLRLDSSDRSIQDLRSFLRHARPHQTVFAAIAHRYL